MPERSWHFLLSDMHEAIERIGAYLHDLDKDRFLSDQRTIDAVVRNLEIIGEAASKIAPQAREQLSEIPWRQIRGMRNRLIHDYMSVDLEIIWKTVEEDLPLLKEQLRHAIEAAGKFGDSTS